MKKYSKRFNKNGISEFLMLSAGAVLTAAGKWQISDIHITDLLDIRTESHYNAT